MVHYEIRPTLGTEPGSYTIAKFEGNQTPSRIYTIFNQRGRLHCTCPGGTYRGKCKHIGMVRQALLTEPWNPEQEDLTRVAREFRAVQRASRTKKEG